MSTLTLEDWLYHSKGLQRLICDDQDIEVVMANLEAIFSKRSPLYLASPIVDPQFQSFNIRYQNTKLTISDEVNIFALAVSEGITLADNPDFGDILDTITHIEVDQDHYFAFLDDLITSNFAHAAILLLESDIYLCPFCDHTTPDPDCELQKMINFLYVDFLEDGISRLDSLPAFSPN